MFFHLVKLKKKKSPFFAGFPQGTFDMKYYLCFLYYMKAVYVNYLAFPHFVNFKVLRVLCVVFLILEPTQLLLNFIKDSFVSILLQR